MCVMPMQGYQARWMICPLAGTQKLACLSVCRGYVVAVDANGCVFYQSTDSTFRWRNWLPVDVTANHICVSYSAKQLWRLWKGITFDPSLPFESIFVAAAVLLLLLLLDRLTHLPDASKSCYFSWIDFLFFKMDLDELIIFVGFRFVYEGTVYQGVNVNVNCPVAQRWNAMDCGVISMGIVQLVRIL